MQRTKIDTKGVEIRLIKFSRTIKKLGPEGDEREWGVTQKEKKDFEGLM